MKFLKRRILDKGAGDEMMSKWDIGHQSIIEKAHEVSKKYPKANTQALSMFRNKLALENNGTNPSPLKSSKSAA